MASSVAVGEQTASAAGARSIGVEAFGVRLGVSADPPELLSQVVELFPPSSRRCVPASVTEAFGILAAADGAYQLTRDDSPVMKGIDLDLALLMLDNQLRISVGLHAPSRIFVHAGVVAVNGRAIVLPGLSMSGKTSLVAALIRAGVVYYSDEFAVLDERGSVHPYLKPLSIRDGASGQNDRTAESLGAAVGHEPLKIGAVIFTQYRPGAKWRPRALSPARGALAMLENTLAAKKRADEAMKVIRRAIDGAVLLQSERGDASLVAPELLDSVSRTV